uniref:Cyclin-dependent kinase inhibitor n=1 Tax=Oxybasis rubra TaxID=3560 RepID=O48597_OXYRB|nr:cyclin-dependent kinase inhibitor protein [Oxybasis rubra]
MAAAATPTSSPAKKIKKVSKSSYNIPQLRSRRKNLSAPENFAELETTPLEVAAVVEEEEVANCSSSEVITTARSDFPPSCCSSNYDQLSSSEPEVVKDDDGLGNRTADPEVESGEASSKQKESHRTEAREATKLDDQDYPATKSTVQIKMPSDSEIEEFFAVAEKDLQKRFSEKYNFDIVKDVPLKGRYDWVPINP